MKVKKAAVALSTILIIIVILTLSGTILVLESIDATKNTVTTVDKELASTYISTCKEEAVRELTFDENYTGTENITLDSINCSFTVSSIDSSNRQIDVVVINNSVTVSQSFNADISTMPITVNKL